MPNFRQLGLPSATLLVVASMVGSGVFTTSGYLLADLHSPWRVLAAWLAGGVLALLGALCYGSLARRFPESGGEYVFLSRTLHPAAGYVGGWVSLLVGFSGPLAAVALAFGEYLDDWMPFSQPRLTGSGLMLLFAAVHSLQVRRGAWVQNAAVLLKLALMVGFVGVAAVRLEPPSPAASGAFPIGAFAVSLVWISFSFSGWNAAVYLGGEVRDPERNLPRAMIWGTALVTALYLALNAVFVFSAPVGKLAGKLEVARIAADALGGAALANFVTALIALALATSASSMLMAGPRVFARMADDGCLPGWLRFPGNGPPRAAILLQTSVALILLWSVTFTGLLTYIGFTLGLCAAATVAGLMRLRWREGPSLKVPGWPWIPSAFIAAAVGMSGFAISREPVGSAIGLATLALPLAWWWFTRGRRG